MGPSGRIARFFLTSQLTPLIALIAALLGLFAILVTPREEEPQINVTMANVFIPFPGASAKDVEALVATPAELTQAAGASPRQRQHHNLHEMSEPCHRLLVGLQPDTYIPPHRHLSAEIGRHQPQQLGRQGDFRHQKQGASA